MYENLKALRDSVGMTQAEFGKSVGVAKSTYNNYETGIREPKSDFWINVAKTYHVTIDYLMGYSDDPHKTNDDPVNPYVSDNVFRFSKSEQRHIEKYRALDLYGREAVDSVLDVEYRRVTDMQAEQGDPEPEEKKILRFPFKEFIEPASAGTGEMVLDGAWKRVYLSKEPPDDADFIVRVRGDSMEPMFYDDDRVFIQSVQKIAVDEIGLFFMDGEEFIKKLGEGALISLNKKYKPKPFRGEVICQGLVLGVCDDSYFEK